MITTFLVLVLTKQLNVANEKNQRINVKNSKHIRGDRKSEILTSISTWLNKTLAVICTLFLFLMIFYSFEKS